MIDEAKIIELAIKEDVGNGDHTSLASVPNNAKNTAKLIAKEEGIIAGLEIVELIAKKIDSNLKLSFFKKDGNRIKIGDEIFSISGFAQSILKAERLMLNILQRMSGIATTTNNYTEKISDLKTKVLDTRKTTPLNRIFEKKAVKIGGAENHRFGLYDMILIKDNHIDFAGGIQNAINSTIKYKKENKLKIKVEIEVRSINELKHVMKIGGIDRILLDNFDIETTKESVKLINNLYETESSGNINLDTIRDYALCGVDFVSVGALTHNIKSLDMSLIINRDL